MEIRLPIYLAAQVQTYLAECAKNKNVPAGELVNGLLRREIEMIESVK